MILSVLSIITFLIGIYLIRKSLTIKMKAEKLIEDNNETTVKINKNNLSIVGSAIEVQIKALNDQAAAMYHLLSELEEKEVTCEEHSDEWKEIVRCIRINSESLDSTEDSISKLESWYFLTYGKHYMLTSDSHLFTDEQKSFSLN